jgi:hypothetical protein
LKILKLFLNTSIMKYIDKETNQFVTKNTFKNKFA